MYKLSGPADAEPLVERLKYAIRNKSLITMTYTKTDGTVTLRTVEPYWIGKSKGGNPILKGLDRQSGEPRSFRLDRIITYTPSKGGRAHLAERYELA